MNQLTSQFNEGKKTIEINIRYSISNQTIFSSFLLSYYIFTSSGWSRSTSKYVASLLSAWRRQASNLVVRDLLGSHTCSLHYVSISDSLSLIILTYPSVLLTYSMYFNWLLICFVNTALQPQFGGKTYASFCSFCQSLSNIFKLWFFQNKMMSHVQSPFLLLSSSQDLGICPSSTLFMKLEIIFHPVRYFPVADSF